MMFDSLVCPLSSDPEEEDCKDSFEIFKGSTKSLCDEVLKTKTSLEDYDEYEFEVKESKDPILKYLQKYYLESHQHCSDNLDSSIDTGDLSWDEGDMLPRLCPKVWTFNDFMEQYNNIYAWLNNIQVQYHADKKREIISPRLESLLRDLERDVERRERFLRECARMVGCYPELEEEVTWRLEHVMTKWEMLSGLRTKSRSAGSDADNLCDIYHDIELEVKCLRRWLREMEARIDPLQFGGIAEWSTRDRERKMAEYQVLQTDIESHGRIVKLVLGLCGDLGKEPGQYDVQHAVKVATSLERRWHGIWLRSLEWQCLLEQWITDPGTRADTLLDTDEEPLAKVARFNTDLDTPLVSPAVTLLRKKKRKRMIQTGVADDDQMMDPEKRIKLKSPRTPRSVFNCDLDQEDHIIVMSSGSDPSSSAPSTSRSDSTSDNNNSVTFVFHDNQDDNVEERVEWRPVLDTDHGEWRQDCDNQRTSTPDQNNFINNTVQQRKVTVINNNVDEVMRVMNDNMNHDLFSQDSLDDDDIKLQLELYESDTTDDNEGKHFAQEHLQSNISDLEMLHFGEDYRLFISSLSDASVTHNTDSKLRNKKLRRKNKRRETNDHLPYESQSEAEFDDIFHVVSQSQRHIHLIEEQVQDYLAHGFVDTNNLSEYDTILGKCSENINVLHNFLTTIDTTQSFVNRKKSRETRLLITRWENVLQRLLENVNHSKNFDKLKDESKHLRDATAGLEEAIQAAISDVDLQTQMRNLKATIDQLTGHKARLDQMIVAVHNFLAELSSSSHVEEAHISLAETLKNEVVELMSAWDQNMMRARQSLLRSEQTAVKLQEIEKELIEFRKSLRLKQISMSQKSPSRKSSLNSSSKSSSNYSSHDSGISDGSSSLSDFGIPEALEHLSRLREMTRNLESSMSPHDPNIQTLSRIINDTSLEIDDLQQLHTRHKQGAKRRTMRVQTKKPVNINRSSLGRLSRLTLTLQAVLMSLLLLSWVCQPQCCDSISAMSPSAFSLKYVNGPPPI